MQSNSRLLRRSSLGPDLGLTVEEFGTWGDVAGVADVVVVDAGGDGGSGPNRASGIKAAFRFQKVNRRIRSSAERRNRSAVIT